MSANPVFFEGLLKANRKLKMDYEDVAAEQTESEARVRAVTAEFLEGYAAFNHIDRETANASYMVTIGRFVRDIREFIGTGKYPLELDPKQWGLGRTDYDLVLMLSVLVTRHRCAIMEEILKTSFPGRPLVIGVGSGLELNFIQAPEGGEAYDLYINPFARQAFPKWNFHQEWYHPSGAHFGSVYAIELLEHLSEPYAFVESCHKSLAPGGRLVTTTATDVPQFDHRYNFVSDDDFEQRLHALGFELELKRSIAHECPQTDIAARNVFYVFRKNTCRITSITYDSH
jgi:SAM-dependent methyltransferase